MAKKSLYQKLVDKSNLMFGRIPNEDRVLWALSQTVREDDLRLYFLIPFGSAIPLSSLQKRAVRLKLTPQALQEALDRMYREAFVMRHETPEGPAYESCPLSMTAEQQVRMKKGSPIGKAFADYWLSLATTAAYKLPTKTPYFRIVPVEATITPAESPAKVRIPVNQPVPDERQVLPLDVVSEVVRNQRLVGVAECYCRAALDMQDDPCSKPRETCFVFNEFGQSLIDLGIARLLTVEEALAILRDCENAGLVHNVDNFQGQIRGMCNCCACHCPGMKATAAGVKNVEAVSRYRVVFDPNACARDQACVSICPVQAIRVDEDGLPATDEALCLGCGLCASICPAGARWMVVREKVPKVPPTPKALQDALMREAVIGLVVSKLKRSS